MSEISKYDEYKNKLQGVCDANGLVFGLKKEAYPIVLVIRPSGGVGEQMSMLEDADTRGYRSPDAYIAFSYDEDGSVLVDPSGRFQISDALFSKIKNLFKKLCFFWLMYFFRDVIQKDSLRRGMMPVINEDDADDRGDEDEQDDENDDDAADGEDEDEDAPEDAPEGDIIEAHSEGGESDEEEDQSLPLIEQATQIVRAENKATVSLLQRRMAIGYSEASRLIDELEQRGVIGPYNGAEPREVLPFDVPDDEAS